MSVGQTINEFSSIVEPHLFYFGEWVVLFLRCH